MILFSFARWFGLTCLALSDPTSKLEFEIFSQSVHIPKVYITKAEESTASNYNLRWSGLSYTLGEVIIGSGQAHGDWQSKLSGKQLFSLWLLTYCSHQGPVYMEMGDSRYRCVGVVSKPACPYDLSFLIMLT